MWRKPIQVALPRGSGKTHVVAMRRKMIYRRWRLGYIFYEITGSTWLLKKLLPGAGISGEHKVNLDDIPE